MSRFLRNTACFLLVMALLQPGSAQEYRHVLRGFDDNDGIDLRGMGSDEGYTNGTCIELLFQPRKKNILLTRLLPKAGEGSINTYGFGVMQVMYTPNNIEMPFPPENDYPYAGGLYATHTFHSANPLKKLNLQSQIVLGFMGPGTGAEGFQKFIHRTFGFITPRGWDTQMPTDLLLNYNFTIEKEIASNNDWLDITAGAEAKAGTMENSVHLFPMLRFGKKFSYYSGLIQQFTPPEGAGKRWQLYGIIKPGVEMVLYNAFYQGGMLNKSSPLHSKSDPFQYHRVDPEMWVGRFDFGAVASTGNLSVYFLQSIRTREVQNIRPHSVGTISVQIAW